MKTRTSLRAALAAASALAVAALAVGCGSASSAGSSNPAAKLNPKDPITLKVAVPQAFGYFATMWQRNVQVPGVKIEYKYFTDSNAMNDAISAGAVDLSDQGEIGPIEFAAEGSQNKVVACTGSNGKNTNLIVRPNVKATNFGQLKGMKIAYAQNNNHELFILHLLKAYHMQPSDIQSVNVVGAAAVSAFESGAVAATSQNSPTAAQLLESVPGSRVIAVGSDYGITNLYCVLATPNAVNNKAPAVAAFISAYEKTIEWAKAHPAEDARLVAKPLGVSVQAARTALDNNSPGLQLIDNAFLNHEQEFANEVYNAKIVTTKLNVRNLFITKFNSAIHHPVPHPNFGT